ncbi:MAG: cation diffusion facilitator family transporter [Clostridiales bacterium]|nr:cation diffusion facilitator family transporter [Clostridiales bacterium]
MITLLSRLFIKDGRNYADPAVRRSYGVLCGGVGIFLNILLFIGKFIAGALSASVAVTADAFNNLSDAGSSVVSLIGFKLSGQKPDPEHPYGHGRLEYISGLIVSMVIVVMGLELLLSSIKKIVHPEATAFSWLSLGILIASILVKGYMFLYNSRTAKKIDSVAMKATATDSLTDCIATLVALIAMVVCKLWGWKIDGWAGALVSLFVLYSGLTAAKDTISPLLGQPPSKELVEGIEETVLAHEEILGIHDLVVHDYGPGRMMMSLHAEVPAEGSMLDLHDLIDNIERELKEKFSCEAVVHMDPVQNHDEHTIELKSSVTEIVSGISSDLKMHDFRIVKGPTHTNIVFDVVVPFKFALTDTQLIDRIGSAIREKHGDNYYTVINIDRSYV